MPDKPTMINEPTVKDCGSPVCGHVGPHEANEFCNPPVPCSCKWNPSCRCIPSLEWSIRGELEKWWKDRGLPDRDVLVLLNDRIMAVIEEYNQACRGPEGKPVGVVVDEAVGA